MNERIDLINSFLKLIAEISKNDIEIDSNIVYSNLVSFNIESEDITHHIDRLIDVFEKSNNINVVKEKKYSIFSSFKFRKDENNIKIYMSFDKKNIYKSLFELIIFLSENNIIHSTKVFNKLRNDSIVITINSLFEAEKIRKFINNNENIKKNLIKPNPFMYSDNNISFAWDGYLSYNLVLSTWISDYINEVKEFNKYECVSYNDLFKFISNKYELIFEQGEGINSFICNNKIIDLVDLLNYKYITEFIMDILNENIVLKGFSTRIKKIYNVSTSHNEMNYLLSLIKKDNSSVEITLEQREIFDFVYIEEMKKIGEEKTIKLFKTFIKTSNYRLFTRNSNIRNMLIENGLSALVIRKIMYEEMKKALINASRKTIKKYDAIQLGKALFGIKNNDYSAFTNEDNVRNNLRLMVDKDEIDDLISSFINSNNSEEGYWIFIELMNKNK